VLSHACSLQACGQNRGKDPADELAGFAVRRQAIVAPDDGRRMRDEDVTVISGFHSPIEKECLPLTVKACRSIWQAPITCGFRPTLKIGSIRRASRK
jgi:hypothetical protein